MRLPDEVKRILVARWLAKAETDLGAAEALLEEDHSFYYPSCFFSQQAAEKYIKAFLTHHQVEFPKTHLFEDLLDLVGRIDGNLADEIEPVMVLNPYGVEVRYPGNTPEPTRAQAEEALSIARFVRDAIMKALPEF